MGCLKRTATFHNWMCKTSSWHGWASAKLSPQELLWKTCLISHVAFQVLAEGVGILIRCLFVVICLMTAPQMGIIIFCWGNFLLTASISLIYYGYFTYYIYSGQAPPDFPVKSVRDFFPKFKMVSAGFNAEWSPVEDVCLWIMFLKTS